MASQWFYQVKGNEVGPFSSAELRNLAQRGVISTETLIKNTPEAAWIPAARVQGLFPASNESPPPIPIAVPPPAVQEIEPTRPVVLSTADGSGTKQVHQSVLILAWIGAGSGVLALVVVVVAIVIGVFKSRPVESVEPPIPPSSKIVEEPAKAVPADAVEARMFTLVDKNGKMRARLSIIDDGPALSLYGKNDKMRAKLSIIDDRPALSVHNKSGKVRAMLSIIDDGPALSLLDESGEVRAMLSMVSDSPGLLLRDENGQTRATLHSDKDFGPGLSLRDENGRVLYSLPP